MTIDPEDLERRVHRALMDLPAPRAPHALRPRVLAALPDGRRTAWSNPARAAVTLLGVATAVALSWAWPQIVAWAASWVPESIRVSFGYVSGAAETSATLGRVAELTWASVVAPIARGLLLVTVLLCAAGALCVAALNRVALGGASRS